MTIKQNLAKITPILSIMSASTLEEVTDNNYKLCIGDEEELVARFLKAYETKLIDRILTYDLSGKEHPVCFDRLTNDEECRTYIDNCLTTYATGLPRDKVSQLSFIKFLYRRIRFFTSDFYQMNDSNRHLGSSVMKQMISEANSLTRIDFQTSNYPRIFLVYDPYFSLHLLHDGWDNVPNELKQIFNDSDPSRSSEFINKDYYAKCLSWLIDIKYSQFIEIMNETKFILTENFAYKIFHVHERKLTKLPLIIEGETGVGKTFLLRFYSLLLNSKVTNGSFQDNIAPRIVERTSLWLLKNIISGILEKELNLLNKFLRRIKSKLVQDEKMKTMDYNNDEHHDSDQDEEENAPVHFHHHDDDPFLPDHKEENAPIHFLNDDEHHEVNDNVNHEQIEPSILIPTEQQVPCIRRTIKVIDTKLLEEIKHALENFEYDKNVLRRIWKVILTVSDQNSSIITQKLIQELYEYVTSHLIIFPLIEASFPLKKLLEETSSPSVQTCLQIFNEYLFFTKTKPLFYRLLLHPGVTEKQLEQFLLPISQLAHQLPDIELVVFFDEINTSSCLGLFKEIFIDRTLHGVDLPKNIFFTGAINPAITVDNQGNQVHRKDYLVHQLPESLENLKVSYGILESKILQDYIIKKIAMFQIESEIDSAKKMPLDSYSQKVLSDSIIRAQEFCEQHLGNFLCLKFYKKNFCFVYV